MTRLSAPASTLLVALASTWLWVGSAWTAEAASAQTAGRTTTSRVAKPTATRTTSRAASAPKSAVKKTVAPKRRVTSARARRAAQQAREARDLATPRYKVDESGSVVPDVRAEAAIVYNPVTQQVLFAENENAERSIA